MTVTPAVRPASADAEWPTERLLASRPRVRRDVLYAQVPEGVLFHDASTGFRVHGRTAYRFATLVVPFLDGRLTVAEICAGLGEPQRAMVEDLVRTLYLRGFARPVPAVDPDREPLLPEEVRDRFEAQIAYVDHHVDGAEERFARFRTTRVAVLGGDPVARWAVLSLIRNGAATVGAAPGLLDRCADLADEADGLRAQGCPVDLRRDPGLAGAPTWGDLEEYDVVVVTPDEQGMRHVLGLLEAGVPAGRTLLPAWQVGTSVAVGPSVGCWMCAALRLAANTDAGAAADLWSGLAGRRATGSGPEGPLAAMIGNLLGYEIFRLTTGALPAETAGQVIVQDVDSLDVDVEPLLRHPQCPLCPAEAGSGWVGTSVAEPSASPHRDRPMPEPGGPEADRLLATLADRAVLVGPRLGIFARFADDALTQTPLRVSTVDLAVGHGRCRRIAAFDVHNVAGARLAALTAAAGVYADHVVPPIGALAGDAAATARGRHPTVRPASLGTSSGLDPDGDTVQAWVAARSMTGGRSVLVPAGAAAPYSSHNRSRAFLRTPAGLGVDDSPERARGAALLSALAHDALTGALRGDRRVLRVDLGALGDDDPVLTFLVRTAATLGVQPDLLELGAGDELPAPVLLARCPDPADGTGRWTVAAQTSWRAAAVTALRDLLGRVQLGAASGRVDTVDTGDPLVSDLDARLLTISGEVAPRAGLARTLAEALERLRTAGGEAFVVDAGSADLAAGGLSVARVLVGRSDDAH